MIFILVLNLFLAGRGQNDYYHFKEATVGVYTKTNGTSHKHMLIQADSPTKVPHTQIKGFRLQQRGHSNHNWGA